MLEIILLLPVVCYLLMKIFKWHHALDNTLHRKRFIFSALLGALMFTYLVCLEFSMLQTVVLTWLTVALYSMFAFHAKLTPDSRLSIQPHLVKPTHAQVHLAHSNQAFDYQTYKELPVVLKRLAELDIQTVTLTSPMFAKKQRQRSIARLEAQLADVVRELDIKPISKWRVGVGVVNLYISKHWSKTSPVKKLDITTWYQVTMTLKSTPSKLA